VIVAVVYYVTWMDPGTGFLRRREFNTHEDLMIFVGDLQRQGIPVTYGHFER